MPPPSRPPPFPPPRRRTQTLPDASVLPQSAATATLRPGDAVLLTGGSGFLGSAVARRLLARGVRLRALIRGTATPPNLEGLDLETARGDLTDPASLCAAAQGQRYLFHVAADYRLWAPDPDDLARVNLDGTRALMRAALEAGIERIVHTSSVATLKVAGATAPVDETATARPEDAIGAYKRSKTLAERAVEEMVARDGLPAVVVNPSTPIGPRDVKPTPTGRMVLDAARGKIPAFVDTGLNLAHVDDIAEGHLLALERGRIGERYILGGEDMTLRAILAEIARLTGRRPPTITLPRAPLMPLAAAMEAVARFTGREPLLTRDGLRMSRHRMFFTSAKAQRDLGYRARPAREALADAVAWFRATGRLA
ncbi:hopanoid-associated sugar epimerase [Roseomonas sp. CCTCC AB2023176]|uniref:hopanoid-associated sugar epimerase n=1 Tax=Roseomonas sp. CCTCC AB2023176 TaxID=3342640 RepID=UPI0035DD95F4